MPEDFIDLVITSPPYNVDLGNNKYNKTPYDLYNDNVDHKVYIGWLKARFHAIYQKMCVGGRCCINIGDGKNGAVPTSSDIIHFMKEIGYIPITHIIWDKSQVGNRTSWGSFLSPSCPSFPTPFEHILVFCKGDRKLHRKGVTDLMKEEFIQWSLALWKFPPETKQKAIGHSAMFPEELPKRCMKVFSWVGAVVYDPFMGAGTTAKVAAMNNRLYVGSEISKEYCEIARRRVDEAIMMRVIPFGTADTVSAFDRAKERAKKLTKEP
jgi:site-specific DNA-methyltransferase (adenine-specific)